MHWYIYCLIPAYLWALSNLIDQHLSRKYFAGDSSGLQATTGIFSFLSGLIVIGFFGQDYPVSIPQVLILIGLGAFLNLSYIPYIRALQLDESKIVIPLFQMIPVMVFFVAWIALGEMLTIQQFIASFVIIAATFGISYDFETWSIKFKTLLLMAIACLGIAIFGVASRYFVHEIHWIPVAGYVMIGAGLFSASVFLTRPKSLNNAITLFQTKRFKILGFFVLIELVSRSAMLLFQKALFIAPATALVQVIIGGFQPLFIVLMTFAFAIFVPDTVAKIKIDKIFAWHLFCIIVMTTGLYFLVI